MEGSLEFEAFYAAQYQRVFKAIYLSSGDSDLAHDLTQDAFKLAFARWRRLSRHDWAGGWVMTTALNLLRKQRKRRPDVTLDPTVSNVELTRDDDASLPPATHDDGVFVPAEPGEPTYILTDFEIRYPYAKVDDLPRMRPGSERREQYCSMPGRQADCDAEGNAGLFYEWEWSTDRFPGVVACQAVLYSKEGEPVGYTNWELSGLEPTSRRPADVLIHVSDKPERAEASCEAGTIESGPTHRFTYLRSEFYNSNPRPETKPQYRYRLLFQVETLTEHSTGMCRLTVRYESGKKHSESFTMTGVPRADEEFELGAPYRQGDPVKDANVRCRTYKRELQD